MAPTRPPPIIAHPRSADEIAARLDHGLAATRFGPPGADALREALVRIGARYGEILTEHLNAAPELHHQLFVTRLGGEASPALPASVVLSFQPVAAPAAEGRAIVVPAHTPVAAPPAAGDPDAVVFETMDDLAVVRAQAVRAFAVDPRRMVWSDLPALLAPSGLQPADLFSATQPIERAICVAMPEVFGMPSLSLIRIEVQVESSSRQVAAGALEWGVLSKDGFVLLSVQGDSTQQFTRSGVVELTPPANWEPQPLNGMQSRWLVCRIVPQAVPQPLAPDNAWLEPVRIGPLRAGGRIEVKGELPAAASCGAMPLDTSRDFFPFGERPRFGDVFQLMAPVFAQAGARVRLAVRMTNPADATSGPIPPVDPEGKPRLKWDIHTAAGWRALAVDDGTNAFTRHGDIAFIVPPDVEPSMMAGRPGPCVRARLASGHWGLPRIVEGVQYPAAPSIESLWVHASVDLEPVAPRSIVRCGVLERVAIDVDAAPFFVPFAVPDVPGPILFVGLATQEHSLKGRTLRVQVDPGPPVGRVVWRAPDDGQEGAAPLWQVRSDEAWLDCAVDDASAGLTRPGIVSVRLPESPSNWPGSTVDPTGRLVWLRLVWPSSASAPRLRRCVLNAVHACQTQRLENEVLGSSTGRAGQRFNTLRAPVVGDPALQVRESMPAPGSDERPAWVPWQRVCDFDASEAGSRHYTFDPRTGRVRFGDGRQGRIPPAGAHNIRMREYRIGGGRRGNQPAGAVAQLRTTLPYIDAVFNREPATGGQDGGDAQAVRRAASAWLRHRGRAVCADDYADLARAASPEVARAYSFGSRDLAGAGDDAALAPGVVSVVVVPASAEPRPQPALDLLGRVKVFLDARRPVTTELVVLGPDYAAVSVRARIGCAPGGSPFETAAACVRRLQAFLHPVSGGSDERGWPPGQRPHRSDLVALLGAVDGVDHVDELQLQSDEPGQDAARRSALVCAGRVEVLT
jgi:hypothetical protein